MWCSGTRGLSCYSTPDFQDVTIGIGAWFWLNRTRVMFPRRTLMPFWHRRVREQCRNSRRNSSFVQRQVHWKWTPKSSLYSTLVARVDLKTFLSHLLMSLDHNSPHPNHWKSVEYGINVMRITTPNPRSFSGLLTETSRIYEKRKKKIEINSNKFKID